MRTINAVWLACALLGAVALPIRAFASAQLVRPEQVYISNAGIACPTQAEFIEIVQHAIRGEATLADQMMEGNGGQCVNFPAGAKIRVLHVDPTVFVGHSVIEFNPADHPGYGGAWGSDQLLGRKLK